MIQIDELKTVKEYKTIYFQFVTLSQMTVFLSRLFYTPALFIFKTMPDACEQKCTQSNLRCVCIQIKTL